MGQVARVGKIPRDLDARLQVLHIVGPARGDVHTLPVQLEYLEDVPVKCLGWVGGYALKRGNGGYIL